MLSQNSGMGTVVDVPVVTEVWVLVVVTFVLVRVVAVEVEDVADVRVTVDEVGLLAKAVSKANGALPEPR